MLAPLALVLSLHGWAGWCLHALEQDGLADPTAREQCAAVKADDGLVDGSSRLSPATGVGEAGPHAPTLAGPSRPAYPYQARAPPPRVG